MRVFRRAITVVLTAMVLLGVVNAQEKIIMDTDLGCCWDDVAALAIVNAAVDQGKAELLAVMVAFSSYDAPEVIEKINNYYDNSNVPVGRVRDVNRIASRPFVPFVANDFKDGGRIDDAVSLYRSILSQQPEDSVTIVAVGPLTNLQALLVSKPDDDSELAGLDLVEKKVKRLIVMGGTYPQGREGNFIGDPRAAKAVVESWPTPIVYSGHEIGTKANTGASICSATPADNPVARIHKYLFECDVKIAAMPGKLGGSFDATAMYYALFGLDGIFTYGGVGGSNHVMDDGSNEWQMDGIGDQRYLVLSVSKPEMSAKIDEVLDYVPSSRQ